MFSSRLDILVIVDNKRWLRRWLNHFLILYNAPVSEHKLIGGFALNRPRKFAVERLDVDDEPFESMDISLLVNLCCRFQCLCEAFDPVKLFPNRAS